MGWHVEDEKLSIDIEYDKPLMRDGKQMKAAVEKCLRLLQKKDATEFDATELEDIPVYKKENAD